MTFTSVCFSWSLHSMGVITSPPLPMLPTTLLSHPRSWGWDSAADWWPPPGCLWCCSCLWCAGGRRPAESSSDGGAGRGASSAGPGTGRPAAAAAGSGSTAPESLASGTSLPPGETQPTVWWGNTSLKFINLVGAWGWIHVSLLHQVLDTFPVASSWTWEALLFSVSCLKDKKAARGVQAGMSGALSSSSSLSSSLSLLLPGQTLGEQNEGLFALNI